MANLKLSLGLIPSTTKIEQEENALIAELEKLGIFSESEELAKYNELDAIVNSADFKNKKKQIESLSYKASEECHKEAEYKKIIKSKEIKLYFKTKEGSQLKKFSELDGSETISKYEELQKLVESIGFKQKQKNKEFKESEDFNKLNEYKSLKANPDIKFYFKFKSSKELANYRNVDGSQKLSRMEELKEYLDSDEFSERKEYLLDKKRFERSELYVQEQEYEKLKKSDDIVWYFKVKDSDKFDFIKKRELTFSDEFDGDKLDERKWIPNTFWGDRLLNDRYSFEADLHCYTESDNTDVRSGILTISTKPQKAQGKVWNPALGGFRLKDFDFTSGIVSSGKHFRQKYGIFSAKIKLNTAAGPRHAFYLLADKITPHIDICRTDKGKVFMDVFGDNGRGSKTSLGSKYSKGYFIYTLEWTEKKLVWKINGIEVFSQTANVPQEEMFINFAGGLQKPMSGSSSMEVDWVRVYSWK